ncbi:MAG: hypothetical protein AB7S36_04270 [Planctomycetota bacterium]
MASRLNPNGIVVIGMHRSGTSAITRLLARTGIELGPPDQLLVAQPSNPHGHFELGPVVDISQRLLALHGGDWHRPPTIPDPLPDTDGLRALRAEAIEQLDLALGSARCWAIKDPRLSVTWPFWRPLLPEAVEVLICVRSPLNVADSLTRRDGFARVDGLRLWQRYVAAILGHDLPRRTVVSYDHLLEPDGGQLEKIAGLARRVLGEHADDARLDVAHLREGLDHSVWHHRSQVSDSLACAGVDVAGMYATLLNEACDGTPQATPVRRMIAAASLANSEAWQRERDAQAAEREQTLASIADSRREAERATTEVALLREQLQQQRDDHAALQAQMAGQQREREQAAADLAVARDQLRQASDTQARLAAQLAEQQREREQAAGELAVARDQLQRLADDRARLESALAARDTQLDERRQEREQATADMAVVRDQLRRAQDDATAAQATVERMHEQVADLRHQLGEATGALQQLPPLRDALSAAREDVARERQRLERLEQQLVEQDATLRDAQQRTDIAIRQRDAARSTAEQARTLRRLTLHAAQLFARVRASRRWQVGNAVVDLWRRLTLRGPRERLSADELAEVLDHAQQLAARDDDDAADDTDVAQPPGE